MTTPALNTAPDMTFRRRADVRLELTLKYHLDSGPVRQYRNATSFFTVRNVRVWLRGTTHLDGEVRSDWQVSLSGVDTATGKPIGTSQILGDDVALANEKTMSWLRPIVEDAQERFAAALERADR